MEESKVEEEKSETVEQKKERFLKNHQDTIDKDVEILEEQEE